MTAPTDFPRAPGSDQPLWRHMHYAACTAPRYPEAAACAAAELLAIAERIVPLEREPMPGGSSAWWRWLERRRIREQLAEEARIADLHPHPISSQQPAPDLLAQLPPSA